MLRSYKSLCILTVRLGTKLAASPQTSGEAMKDREGEDFLSHDSLIFIERSTHLSSFHPRGAQLPFLVSSIPLVPRSAYLGFATAGGP